MPPDGHDPLGTLVAARPGFGLSTEAEALDRFTELNMPEGDLDWLEVGAGDGRNLERQLRRHSHGRRIRTVALEPMADAPAALARVEWRRQPLEEYAPDRSFDWINLRHSAYYVRDALAEVARIACCLRGGGALALTHWSRRCSLYRLHRAIVGASGGLATAAIEDVAAELTKDPRLVVGAVETHDTELLVDDVASDPSLAPAVFHLSRRGMPSLLPTGTDPAAFVSQTLRSWPDARVRSNGLLLIRRAAT